MYRRLTNKQNGKSYKLACEQINDLELRIEFCKKFKLDYSKEEQKLNELYNKIKEEKHNGNE